jgi:hypothetical protein
LSRFPLDVIEVADRRLGRAAIEMAAHAAADGQTEVTVLLPTRSYRRSLAFLLHGRNADRMVDSLSRVPHVNATIVPFNVADIVESQRELAEGNLNFDREHERAPGTRLATFEIPGTTPIADLHFRRRAKVAGRIKSVRVQPWSGTPALECTVTDGSGPELLVVFLGRRDVPGIRTGTQILIEGMIGERRGGLAVINPTYELLTVPSKSELPQAEPSSGRRRSDRPTP